MLKLDLKNLPGPKQFQKGTTRVFFTADRAAVSISVHGRISKKQRRTVALSIFRKVIPLFNFIGMCWIKNSDDHPMQLCHNHSRGIPLGQSILPGKLPQRFGYWLRIRRLELGLTQKGLAAVLELNHTHISRIEHGKHLPHESTQKRIRQILGNISSKI